MVCPLIAFFTDDSLGFEGRCEVTEMNVAYSHLCRKVPVDHKDEIWGKGELMLSQYEI